MTDASPAASQGPGPSEVAIAFSAVTDMEGGVDAARDYANVILNLCEDTFKDAGCACAVVRIGEQLREHIAEIETYRGLLFRLPHPRRAEFEKSGWPDDKAAEDDAPQADAA
jgi:hypothetical protein